MLKWTQMEGDGIFCGVPRNPWYVANVARLHAYVPDSWWGDGGRDDGLAEEEENEFFSAGWGAGELILMLQGVLRAVCKTANISIPKCRSLIRRPGCCCLSWAARRPTWTPACATTDAPLISGSPGPVWPAGSLPSCAPPTGAASVFAAAAS